MAEKVYTERQGREEKQRLTVVPSFTTPDKSYLVRGESCNCKAHVYGRGCRKHVETAEAFERIEATPFGDGEKGRLSERVLRLAKRIYARPRATETAADSYTLYLDTLRERFATERMRQRAYERHQSVSERYFGKGRAA